MIDILASIIHATNLSVPPGATFPEWFAALLLQLGLCVIG